jgi:Secretion system C-terminal sorting domain
LVQD